MRTQNRSNRTMLTESSFYNIRKQLNTLFTFHITGRALVDH